MLRAVPKRHQERKRPWLLSLALASSAISLVLVGLALLGPDGVMRHDALRANIRELNTKNQALQRENRDFSRRLRAFQEDPAYVDHVIRHHLGWVRENEVLFVPSQAKARGF